MSIIGQIILRENRLEKLLENLTNSLRNIPFSNILREKQLHLTYKYKYKIYALYLYPNKNLFSKV